jgi:hypothetical protein
MEVVVGLLEVVDEYLVVVDGERVVVVVLED